MGPRVPNHLTLEETVLFYGLSLTWVWYLFGALYVVAPAIGWSLLALWLWRCFEPESEFPNTRPTTIVVLWSLGMVVMLLALLIGHVNWNLGLFPTIKSSIGWMKGWALFSIFILVGACMQVRISVLTSAATRVALHTLFLVPLFILAPKTGLPSTLYVSPLKIIGGPGLEYFSVQLYGQAFDGGVRWRFFAPWAPAACVAFGALLPLLLRNVDAKVKALCILATTMVVVMTKSRLGLVSIPFVLIAGFWSFRLFDSRVLIGTSVLVFIVCLTADLWLPFLLQQVDNIRSMRSDSSYVRDTLANIAIHRWITEAPVWGHGAVERGPHLVEYMPIGSHHTWYGLLFVKGAVGFAALVVPLIYTLAELLLKAQRSDVARTAFLCMLFLSLTTFTENVEIVAYLVWPAFVVIGIASRVALKNPFAPPQMVHEPKPSLRSPATPELLNYQI